MTVGSAGAQRRGPESGRQLRVLTIRVGLPRTYGAAGAPGPSAGTWTTGAFKEPVSGRVWLAACNLAGDGQADLSNHGGPQKAVCVYPVEHYRCWQDDLSFPALREGGFGENFTTAGLVEADVCIGDVYEIGTARVQVSQPRQPCWKLPRRWGVADLALRVQRTGRTGWYFRVLREGEVEAGLPLVRAERPYPEWTVQAANEIMHLRKQDLSAAQALAACPALSPRWRETLLRRASMDVDASTSERLGGSGG